MGTKYPGESITGYNSTPPSDDGTVSEANKVKYSTIKTKLSDPVKTLSEAINTALQTHFNMGPTALTSNTTLGASHYNEFIQVSGSSVTLTLSDAATLGAGWQLWIINTDSSNSVTIGRATGADTINGSAADYTLLAGQAIRVFVNAAASGFRILPYGDVLTNKANTFSGTNTFSSSIVGTGTVNFSGAVLQGASPLVFEGATSDAFETTFAITDPTADRTVTFQDATGTVVLRDSTDTLTNKTLTSPVINSATGIGQTVSKRKTADESVTSSATLQDDDHLTFSIAASEEYTGVIHIDAGANLTVTGFKVAITVPASATLEVIASYIGTTANETLAGRTTTSGSAALSTTPTGSANAHITIAFWVLNSTNAGSVTLQWAQAASSGSALTFRKGSSLTAVRIA